MVRFAFLALRRLIEITLPLRPHPPGAWRLTSSLPQSPYCKYDSVGPSGRTRHPPRWAVPSLGKIIYVILLSPNPVLVSHDLPGEAQQELVLIVAGHEG